MLDDSELQAKRARLTANTRRWRHKHRDEWLAYAREYNRKWRKANRDKCAAYARQRADNEGAKRSKSS